MKVNIFYQFPRLFSLQKIKQKINSEKRTKIMNIITNTAMGKNAYSNLLASLFTKNDIISLYLSVNIFFAEFLSDCIYLLVSLISEVSISEQNFSLSYHKNLI